MSCNRLGVGGLLLVVATLLTIQTHGNSGHRGAIAFSERSVPADDNFAGLVAPIEISEAVDTSTAHPPRATSHPHGDQLCASGCALSRHPVPHLAKSEYDELIAEYQRSPPSEAGDALDALIFYGSQTRSRMRQDPDGLAPAHREFLSQHLTQERFVVEIRVVDELGRQRIYLPPTSVPQHVRQEFRMDVNELSPALTSGTVKRVGLSHAWQRL